MVALPMLPYEKGVKLLGEQLPLKNNFLKEKRINLPWAASFCMFDFFKKRNKICLNKKVLYVIGKL